MWNAQMNTTLLGRFSYTSEYNAKTRFNAYETSLICMHYFAWLHTLLFGQRCLLLFSLKWAVWLRQWFFVQMTYYIIPRGMSWGTRLLQYYSCHSPSCELQRHSTICYLVSYEFLMLYIFMVLFVYSLTMNATNKSRKWLICFCIYIWQSLLPLSDTEWIFFSFAHIIVSNRAAELSRKNEAVNCAIWHMLPWLQVTRSGCF